MKLFRDFFVSLILTLIITGCDDMSSFMTPEWTLSVNARYLNVDKTDFSFGANQNLYASLSISSVSTAWMLDGGGSWISTSQTEGDTDASILITAMENESADDIRTCIMLLKSKEVDYQYSCPLSFTQGKAVAHINTDQQNLSFAREASQQIVIVDSNTKWQASCSADWVTLSVSEDNASLFISVTENLMTKERATDVILLGATESKIHIVQAGSMFDDLVASLYFGNKADSQDVEIVTNGIWSASSDQAWISLSPQTGKGRSLLNISVSSNPNENERNGVVTVVVGDIIRKITITQDGTYFTINTTSDDAIPAKGGVHVISFNISDNWKARSNSIWVDLTPVSGGKGENTLRINASENTSNKERFDTTYIVPDNDILQPYRIITRQAGFYFNVTVSRQLLYGSDGGTAVINIETDDNWKVTSCPDWIVLNCTEGNGNKSISTTITALANATKREGSIIIESKSCGCKELPVVQISDDYQPWLSFTADSYQTLKFTAEVPNLEFSINGGTWQTLGTQEIGFGGNIGDLRLRNNNPYGTNGSTIVFGTSANVSCNGDIRTLVDYGNYTIADTKEAKFSSLFSDCEQLVSAPELPSMVLADNCYNRMFSGCERLTLAPELPATELSNGCYCYMFLCCESLIEAPQLPALSLANNCYHGMFFDCKSLSVAPQLPATNLCHNCYRCMFLGCKSLIKAPDLPATTLGESCYFQMFDGCYSLRTAPRILPATKLENGCYCHMFVNCELTEAPELPAIVLAESCYCGMFIGNPLTTAPRLPATVLAEGCYCEMFSGCYKLIIAPELPAETLENSCYKDMFQNCTSLTRSPVLRSPILKERCYAGMFYGCSNLKYVTMTAIDISAHCAFKSFRYGWLDGVSPTGTFVKNAEATWDKKDVIPDGWTVLEE